MIPAKVRDSIIQTQRGRRDERGYIVVLVSLMLVVIVLMVAVAVDTGIWYNKSSKAQRAADSAALSAIAELSKQKKAGASVTAAQTAASNVATAVAKDNGFDTANTNITVTTTFTTGTGGSDIVQVTVKQTNLPTFFGKGYMGKVTVTRTSKAAMSSCAATCTQSLIIHNDLATRINTSVGGDGWQAEIAGDYVFNLYHHDSGAVLYCVNKIANASCGSMYPVAPYAGMETNYTPKLAPQGTKVFFIVQQATTVGLGCWDGATNALCTGFTTPKAMAAYKPNGGSQNGVRMDGPELVGTELFMYGDDNKMYCYDTSTSAFCTGYPKNTSLAGVHDFVLNNTTTGISAGVKNLSGQQFDMIVHPTSNKIYTIAGPMAGGLDWLQCWDPATDASCTGFTNPSATTDRRILYFEYDTTGTPTYLCARAGKPMGGSGQQCFQFTGAAKVGAPEVTFTFDNNSGEQEASGMNANQHFVTFFPMNGSNSASCWDWTTHAACAIAASNWNGTSDYAYTYDGNLCMVGLGHQGDMWTFNITNGQYPCIDGPAGASGRLTPCKCQDNVTTRWTALTLNKVTEVNDFQFFTVTVKLPNGTVWYTQDWTATGADTVDLRLLNNMSPVPAYVDISIRAQAVTGASNEVFILEQDGVSLASGLVPTLVS